MSSSANRAKDGRSTPSRRVRRNGERRVALGVSEWVVEARRILIATGIASVKIGHIASRLKVKREAFYWHFEGLSALHAAMLVDWERTNSIGYRSLIDPANRDGAHEFRELNRMWVQERDYDPAWDLAVRDWARTSETASRALKRVDEERIKIIRQMFLHMGSDGTAATVHARIAYLHQVGYYAVGLKETRAQRMRLLSLYLEFLAGAAAINSARPDLYGVSPREKLLGRAG